MSTDKLSMDEYTTKEARLGIIPVRTSERMYSFLDLALVAGSFAIATWVYVQGISLASVMSMPQSLLSTFGAFLVAIPLVVLIGAMANRYGIDHWILSRSTFGYLGTFPIFALILISTVGWSAVVAELFGSSVVKLLGEAGIEITSVWGIRLIALLCPILGFIIAFRGIGAVRLSSRIMTSLLVLVGFAVLLMVVFSGDLGGAWNAEPLSGVPADRTAFMLGTEWNIAFVFSWVGTIGALTRVTRTARGSTWGLYFGYGILCALFIGLGALLAFVAVVQGSEPSADPTDYLLTVGGGWMGLMSLILVGVANIGTLAVGTFGMALSSKILRPSLRYEWTAAVFMLAVVALTLWGGVLEHYGTFLAYVGIIAGPAVTLMVVDYYIVRSRKLTPAGLFESKLPAYRYTYGFNLVSFVAFGAGFASFLLVYDPVNYAPRSTGLFNTLTATGTACIVSAVVYVGLSAIPAVRRYVLRDRQSMPAEGAETARTGEWSEQAGRLV